MKRFSAFILAALICVLCVVPAFASPTINYDYPDISTVWDKETYPYAVLFVNTPNSPLGVYFSGEMPSLNGNSILHPGGYCVYTYTSGDDEWKFSNKGSSSLSSTYYPNKFWASVDIYDTDGNLAVPYDSGFFPNPPPPLTEVVQGVTEETLVQETLPALGGTMKILVVCGVGLLASLIVLSLFGKRSLIFRR